MPYKFHSDINPINFKILPLCQIPEVSDKLCELINSEWQRSHVARLRTLNATNENFPFNLVLLNEKNDIVGHCKLSLFQLQGQKHSAGSVGSAGFIQSVIIQKEYRGCGLGKQLMLEAESYLKRRGINFAYLTTEDQQGFYSHLGYTECSPVDIFSNCTIVEDDRKDSASTKNNSKNNSAFSPPPPPPLPPQGFTESTNFYKGTKVFMMKYL